MNEFSVLSEYLKGETFYYYYSPENKILDAIWGFGGHKMDGVPWTARRTKEEAQEDQQKYLKDNGLIDMGRRKVPMFDLKDFEKWYNEKRKSEDEKQIIKRIEYLQTLLISYEGITKMNSALASIFGRNIKDDKEPAREINIRIDELKQLLLHI